MLTLKEAAARCNISDSRLRRLIYSGDLKATRMGPVWMIAPRELERFMERPRPHGVHRASR